MFAFSTFVFVIFIFFLLILLVVFSQSFSKKRIYSNLFCFYVVLSDFVFETLSTVILNFLYNEALVMRNGIIDRIPRIEIYLIKNTVAKIISV